jgi:metacaspase-1
VTLRRALLVGINAYPHAPLSGCLNDVAQIQDLLGRYFGFTSNDVHVLLDAGASGDGIRRELAWLGEGGSDPDSVRVFHYSGHGSYVADQNGDEPDGRDECLVPVDYETNGMLIDDDLKRIYDSFPRSGNLTLVMDSCHSGSVQKEVKEGRTYRFIPVSREEQGGIDLAAAKFNREKREFVVDQLMRLGAGQLDEATLRSQVADLIAQFEKVRFGDIRVRESNVLLAACRPDQTAADAWLANGSHGAFTYFLAQAVEQANGDLTYRELASRVADALAGAQFLQMPQLEYASEHDGCLVFRPF